MIYDGMLPYRPALRSAEDACPLVSRIETNRTAQLLVIVLKGKTQTEAVRALIAAMDLPRASVGVSLHVFSLPCEQWLTS